MVKHVSNIIDITLSMIQRIKQPQNKHIILFVSKHLMPNFYSSVKPCSQGHMLNFVFISQIIVTIQHYFKLDIVPVNFNSMLHEKKYLTINLKWQTGKMIDLGKTGVIVFHMTKGV